MLLVYNVKSGDLTITFGADEYLGLSEQQSSELNNIKSELNVLKQGVDNLCLSYGVSNVKDLMAIADKDKEIDKAIKQNLDEKLLPKKKEIFNLVHDFNAKHSSGYKDLINNHSK